MNVQEYNPSEVLINPAIAARKGDPNKKKIAEFAENMVSRREQGRMHQIQPGLVTVDENDVATVIVGRHRLEAEKLLNTKIGPDDEMYTFYAIAIPSTDEQALIDAIEENAWRNATTPEDRGYAMGLLADMGKTHAEIAKHFKVGESTVGETLRYIKLPAKFRKMVAEGLMTEEAAFTAARYNKDAKAQEDIMNLAISNRAALDAIAARAEGHTSAEAEGEAETEDEESDAAEGTATGKKSTHKAPKSDAVKKKAAGGKKTPGKVTADDVKAAAKKLGKNKKKTDGPKGRSKADFITFLAASYGPNVEEEIAAPILELAEKLEEYFDNKISDRQMKNAFEKCCKAKF